MHAHISSPPGRRRELEGRIEPDDQPESDDVASWRAGRSTSSNLLFALHIEVEQLGEGVHSDISSPPGRRWGLEGGIEQDD